MQFRNWYCLRVWEFLYKKNWVNSPVAVGRWQQKTSSYSLKKRNSQISNVDDDNHGDDDDDEGAEESLLKIFFIIP